MNWSNSNQSIDESKFLRKTYIIMALFHRNKHSISSVKFLFHANKIKKINNWQLYKLKYIEHIFWGRKLFLTPLQKCGYRDKRNFATAVPEIRGKSCCASACLGSSPYYRICSRIHTRFIKRGKKKIRPHKFLTGPVKSCAWSAHFGSFWSQVKILSWRL